MNNKALLSRKVGKLSGKLVELGQFGQRGTEMQYSFIKVAEEIGTVTTLQRVVIPGELNRMLEIGEYTDLFLTRRGMWHYCYGVRAAEKSAQSYRGYRLFFIFNRLMMYVNLTFGVYLLLSPGLVWAGAGLLMFGLLFAYMGPASPRRMNAFFLANVQAEADEAGKQTGTSCR